MSLLERFKRAYNGFRLKKEETVPHATRIPEETSRKTRVEKKPERPDYTFGWKGLPRRAYAGGDFIDVKELRRLALTPTPYMCIQRLDNDVMNTQWEVIPLAKEGQKEPDITAKNHAEWIRNWLYFQPNENGEPFMHVIAKAVTDLLILDAGVIIKEYGRTGNRSLVQIWARDGGAFWKEVDKYGRLGKVFPNITIEQKTYKNYKVGYWFNVGQPRIPWEPHEVIYMMQYPRADIPYGTSKMYVIKTLIGALMHGEEWYYEYWLKGGIGSCIIGTEGELTDAQWKSWTERLKNKLEASGIKQIPMDRAPTVQPLGMPEQIKWLETKDEYRHLVMAIFNTTPEILGFTKDIHKATAESQRSVYIRRGLYPLLRMLEWYINTQIIAEFFTEEYKERGVYAHGHKGRWAGQPVDVLFRFKLFDPIGERQKLEIDEKRLKLGLTTINKIRAREGLKPVPWGNINPLFLLFPQQWSQSFWGYDFHDPASWSKLTGLPAPTEVLSAVQPKATDHEIVKAYKLSRIEETERK